MIELSERVELRVGVRDESDLVGFWKMSKVVLEFSTSALLCLACTIK